jgi:hypothetical protein
MKLSLVAILAAALVVPAFTGCASEDESPASQESDVEEGSSASCEYEGKGNELYKATVEAAKSHLANGCGGDPEVYQTDVFEMAQDAVDTCDAVSGLFAKSEWAGTVREVLGPLQVAYLAGKLDGYRGAMDPEAVQSALAGQTFWTVGQGVYGSPFTWHLLEDGRYELESIVVDEEAGDVSRQVTESGAFVTTLGDDGRTYVSFEADEVDGEIPAASFYVLERVDGELFTSFQLVPADGAQADDGSDVHMNFDPNECSA